MEQDYFDDDLDRMRKKRQKKRKRKKARKHLLAIVGILVIGVATFFGTIKIVRPDFDYSLLLPDSTVQVASYIKEKVNIDIPTPTESTTESTEPTTTTTTTTTTTEPDYYDYLDSSEFKFDSDSKGNFVGNLLNGGRIAKSPSYIYNLAYKKGIYRFVPYSEDYAISYTSKDELTCLNLVGDYLYFVNKSDDCLYSLMRGTSDTKKLAEDVDFAYVYGTDVYYISGLNTMCYMNLKTGDTKKLYDTTGKLKFVGISLGRVFFTDNQGSSISYLSVDKQGKDRAERFMADTESSEIKCMVMEDGFLYYYQQQGDGDYDLVRKKFGSDKTVTMLHNVRPLAYPIVDANKLYYAVLKGNSFRMREYNMNTKSKKTMLSVSGVSDAERIHIYHGGEYDFIIGRKSENGDMVYIGSGMYSSSSNVMTFSDGGWKYKN